MPGNKQQEWWLTEDRIARLEKLWAEGVTTMEMARELGCTKSAVIGKVHRIGLQPRVETRPPLRPVSDPFREANGGCLWGIGYPDQADFRFCAEPKAEGDPNYCQAHRAKAYIRPVSHEKRQAAWTEERRDRARANALRRNRQEAAD